MPAIHRDQSRTARSSYLQEAKNADWQPVLSSNVQAIAFNPSTHHMFIEFYDPTGKKPPSLYIYFDVPIEIWESFLIAPSYGQFVWYIIREEGQDRLFDPVKLY